MNLLNFFILFKLSLCYNLPINTNTQVFIHLDKFNERYNLMHIGISFNNFNNYIRYDFRAFNDGKSYITTENERYNIRYIFPDIFVNTNNNIIMENTNNFRDILLYDFDTIHSKNILWGISNKTIDEIIEYEEKYLQRRYKLGIYDCRHYVNKFTQWCLYKPTPIWDLHLLWEEY